MLPAEVIAKYTAVWPGEDFACCGQASPGQRQCYPSWSGRLELVPRSTATKGAGLLYAHLSVQLNLYL